MYQPRKHRLYTSWIKRSSRQLDKLTTHKQQLTIIMIGVYYLTVDEETFCEIKVNEKNKKKKKKKKKAQMSRVNIEAFLMLKRWRWFHSELSTILYQPANSRKSHYAAWQDIRQLTISTFYGPFYKCILSLYFWYWSTMYLVSFHRMFLLQDSFPVVFNLYFFIIFLI